jgi:hypothetical protein
MRFTSHFKIDIFVIILIRSTKTITIYGTQIVVIYTLPFLESINKKTKSDKKPPQ